MLKFFRKQMNKKGFTLIELIVVIAILAILAALAIPRFAGFTERAKEGNDEEYAALVANSVLVLAAADEFTYSTGDVIVIQIGGADGIPDSITVDGGANIVDADLLAEIAQMVASQALESELYTTAPVVGIEVTTDDDGSKDYDTY
jgi:prepilin-type N-terminal cleavage/methylation domain-containing protein